MQDTKTRLLREAEVIVRAKGYSGFSYADLEAAVGIRKASIHHHFKTKENLVSALVDEYDRRYDDELSRIIAENRSAIEKIDAYGRLYVQGLQDDLGCLCAVLAIELHALPVSLTNKLSLFFDKHIAWIEAVIEDGLARGEIRPSVQAASYARMTVAALEGALLMERVLQGVVGFEATLDAIRKGLG
ncbi:TetR/AcrR family transcriptional regulator [Acidomonas methanolica]|uniref:Transcriptional regulator TetR n=1 Tax=Acidomonas methanolica NBRC 104435 TaxID=1231351 RepID=A0A023D7E5_ACIMT|nr:TetR/AcrR family transcriptional regulator [Acidomonas methanolica]TCS23327.1 TetR family transcriptional regulator [Acidomonas methanolica]GAJ29686.1 transcriptional regulator TetR [Acidomonas methanolica NBRC 104435]GBQ52686.1 transcriptional regulator [Acidomonas methanolica]GEL00270.1 TetR family transcriptional regulator [Acidomonas methanolica NBRC 104435]